MILQALCGYKCIAINVNNFQTIEPFHWQRHMIRWQMLEDGPSKRTYQVIYLELMLATIGLPVRRLFIWRCYKLSLG